MGRYVKEDNVYYWITDNGDKIPVDVVVPQTPMRRNFFRPFVVKAMKIARSRIDKDNPLTERVKRWKENQNLESITKSELFDRIGDKEVFIDQKVDGQTALMEYEDGEAKFGSLGGRVHSHIPVLEEIEDILEKKDIHSATIVGELAGYNEGKILSFRETQSLIKDPKEGGADKLHWFPYEILSLNNEDMTGVYDEFIQSRKKLEDIFEGSDHIHVTKSYKGDEDKAKKAWKALVEDEDNEGVVVRFPDGDIYKSKPIFSYDLVIIAVGDKKLKAWPDKKAGNILVAFMDGNKIFRVAGEVGTGWTQEQRKELYDWAHDNKVGEDDHYVWVKPEKIVEVKWERSNIMKNKAYRYENGEYKEVGKKWVGTVVKPVFVRYRDDKDVKPGNLRLEQIPNWDKRVEEKTEKTASIEPLTFNEFICRQTLLMIINPDSDNYFPPQRAFLLYEEYKKKLARGDKDVRVYHDIPARIEMCHLPPSTNDPKEMVEAINRAKKRVAQRVASKIIKRTAGYPDHPEEVVIDKSENILEDQPEITELDVWSYYEGIQGDLIKRLEGNNIFVVIKTDGKTIYKRHPYDEDTEFIRINNKEDFKEYHTGRTVEYHVTADGTVPFYAVDMDPPGYSTDDFNRAKKAARKVADALADIDGVDSVDIHYSGKRGFHIFGNLGYRRNVNEAREFMDGWLKDNFGDDKDFVLSESPRGGKIALGLAPLKENGGHIARWSMRVSGLCCVPVDKDDLDNFQRGDATPEKVHKKLTGKELKRIKKAFTSNLPKRVVHSFLNRESLVWTEPTPITRTKDRIHRRRFKTLTPPPDIEPKNFAKEGDPVEVLEHGRWVKRPWKKNMAPLVEKGDVRNVL